MQISYKRLFSVYFKHNYYVDNNYSFFKISICESTRIIFKKFNLTIKNLSSGFSIYHEIELFDKEPIWKKIKESAITLRFLFENNNDIYFLNYTNGLEKLIINDCLLYFNNIVNPQENGRLHANEFADIDNTKSLDSELFLNTFIKPFGIIDIDLQQLQPESYFIQFDAKTLYWRYVITTQYLLEIENLSVINKSDKSVFTGPVPFKLPDNRNALLFTSGRPLTINEQPNKYLQLVENYNVESGRHKVVLQMLPNPDIRHISLIDMDASAEERIKYAEVII